MADKVQNPYIELYDQLHIPERLEPKNIAAMLDRRMAEMAAGSEKPSFAKPERAAELGIETQDKNEYTRNITVTSSKKRTAAFRSIASVAACAALALGVAGYMNAGRTELPDDRQPADGGAYASDYDDVHKTFQKYYVDDSDKMSLDSAIQDIEHSYDESVDQSGSGTVVTAPATPETEAPTTSAEPPIGEPVGTTAAPETEVIPDEPAAPPVEEDPVEIIDSELPLPENAVVIDNSDIAFGNGFILKKDSNTLRIIDTSLGSATYAGNIFPLYEQGAAKTLEGFYTSGTRVVAVYSVVKGSVQSAQNPDGTFVGSILDSLYGPEQVITEEQSSVEVCIYDLAGGTPAFVSTTVQDGSLIDMNFTNGSLYLVTAYSDYRNTPIIDVNDYESYLPSYTVNGLKCYVSASDIMIPDYLSNTDYTVISGINSEGSVSIKAVLGYEGRVILKNGAVYLLGYDNSMGIDLTSVKVFSLAGGNVIYSGFVDIDGVALSGDGISAFGDAIAIASVKKSENGYTTTLGVYDGTMNLISRVPNIDGALTKAKRIGNTIYLSGSKGSCGIDLTNPALPVMLDSGTPKEDKASGLVQLGSGYVTLTKSTDGSLVLAKLSKNAAGELSLDYKATVSDEADVTSKALENNGILFISGDIVGLPYGYFDGLDYCYCYALYRDSGVGFELMGTVSNHETDEAFEYGKAVYNDGVLYLFADGRVSSAVISDSFAIVSNADIIESSHGVH